MTSRNLEQGIQSVQQKDMVTGRRLIKIALKNDNLNQQERVQALIWLAETDTSPQYRVEQYQEAIKIDPSNQDVLNRLTYWAQQAQQEQNPQNPAAQNMPPASQNQQPDWQQTQQEQQFNQQFTPSQPMPPVQPGQQFKSTQDIPPVNPNQQQFNQQYTPSQGVPPVNPNQQQFNQQYTPSQGVPPVNSNQQQFNQQYTPSQGMSSVNPNHAGSNNQGYRQQFPLHQTGSMPAAQSGFGQPAPMQIPDVQRTVGILGGPNGNGTGFFVSRDGLIVTTRHVVGGKRQVTVQLMSGTNLTGDVVRAYPAFDLALIQVNVQLAHLLGVSQAPAIPDDTPIVAVTHSGEGIRSAKRRSMNSISTHWFPTIINHMKDAGGNPVFDVGNNMLVGMLTNNASRTNGYMYGLHIHKIYQCIDAYIHEKGQLEGQNTIYCNACGVVSRAPSFGGHFCENCGNTHPYAVNTHRYPQLNLAQLYGEDARAACPKCSSQAGFYERECLRCGHQL